MARRVLDITISAEGRDMGKVFRITELPAEAAEEWAARALLALAQSGAAIPDDVAAAGLAGVASMGMKAFAGLSFDTLQPLLRDMFACVQIVPNPAQPMVARAPMPDDIEEVKTRLQLRGAVFELHTGFSMAAIKSISGLAAAGRAAQSNTETSPASSA